MEGNAQALAGMIIAMSSAEAMCAFLRLLPSIAQMYAQVDLQILEDLAWQACISPEMTFMAPKASHDSICDTAQTKGQSRGAGLEGVVLARDTFSPADAEAGNAGAQKTLQAHSPVYLRTEPTCTRENDAYSEPEERVWTLHVRV